MESNEEAVAAQRLLELVNASWVAQGCYVMARLGIPDLLSAGPLNSQELAARTGAHAPALHRLLNALGSVDICRQRDGRFELTSLGRRLCTDAPFSMRAWTLQWGGEAWRVWANLLHSVQTGTSARSLLTGLEGFGHLERDPQAAQIFNQAMVELTRLAALDIARAYDFSDLKVMDVGGGYGALLAQILEEHPQARGVLFDMPHAISRAREYLGARGVAQRCEFQSGDFFQGVPGGADRYVLKTVIHDWPDDKAVSILQSCRRALKPGARVLIVERLMPERLEPSKEHQGLARVDLHMLVALGAQERSLAQMVALLHAAGLKQVRQIPVGGEFQILEAMPEPAAPSDLGAE